MRTSTKTLRTSLASLLLLGAASSASAQVCPPGHAACVYGGVGLVPPVRGAQVIITIGPPPPPPPPVVIVRPAPPPPPVVIVRPAPPPPPPQQVVVVQPYRQVVHAPPQAPPQPQANTQRFGLRFFVAGASGSAEEGRAQLGGAGAALRIRPRPGFAVDLGVGALAGTDYHGEERVEVPLTADFIGFLNPQHRAQVYLLGGIGTSLAYGDTAGDGTFEHRFSYVGAQAGLGVEFRLRPRFAINLDGRGFVRKQTDGAPEFTRVNAAGDVETTRVSGGFLGTFGATLYF